MPDELDPPLKTNGVFQSDGSEIGNITRGTCYMICTCGSSLFRLDHRKEETKFTCFKCGRKGSITEEGPKAEN